MDSSRHDRLGELFEQAAGLQPEARERFIEACSDDPSIRTELRSLLAACERAPNLLERVAADVVPEALRAAAADSFMRHAARDDQPLMTIPPVTSGPGIELSPGSRLGAYEIKYRLGAGGIGVVYCAFDTVLQRTIAIKTLASRTPDAPEALLREARAASALNHPHICTVYEVGEHDGCPYIAMEYIDGLQLRELIPKGGMPAPSVTRFGIQVAKAVEHAHRQGVIHRDLKSANVLVSKDSQAKVLDFGLASRLVAAETETLTRTSADSMVRPLPLAGTLPYLSPELLRGFAADRRSDVWALGVLLYEMAAGHLPFEGATPFELTAAILDKSVPALPSNVPPPLGAVIGRCLERDGADRYQHAGEVRVALETLQFGSDSSLSVPDARLAHVAPIPWWRRRVALAGLMALVAAAVAFIVFRDAMRAPVLTDRDTLMVADFLNTTGDSVFDGTLTQAVSIHLEQSPFLRVVSREGVQGALRLMARSPDELIANDVAREACQRLGARAIIQGSIAPVGGHYAIALNALNCETAETIASEQGEAERREQVLTVVSRVASRLRGRLGESLASVQRFDAAIPQATTNSLEALKAFSAGEDTRARSSESGSIAFYKRAIELDPDFATAYARLSAVYISLGNVAESRRMSEEAYARRDRVSERERFYIEGRHCFAADDPQLCYVNVHELWTRTYPRDGIAHGNLGNGYWDMGLCDKAVEPAAEAVRLDPGYSQPYGILARSYLCLGRTDEARRTLEQALARHLESPWVYSPMFRVAVFDHDDRSMATVRQWASGRPEESLITDNDADAHAAEGRMRRSRELRRRAEQLAPPGARDPVQTIRARGAFCEAAQNDFGRARAILASTETASIPSVALGTLITAAVLAQDYPRANALLERMSSANPQSRSFGQLVRALIDIERGDRAAIERVPPADPRELAQNQSFRPIYVRGLIYLRAGDGSKAAAEFQRILDHRGADAISLLYPLAFVQQARAFVLLGDQTKARKAYEDFFHRWKDADDDVPILRDARQEYTRLNAHGGN